MTPARFRRELRDQHLAAPARREVEARMRITDADIDRYLAEQQVRSTANRAKVNLAHLLICSPREGKVLTGGSAAKLAENLLSRAWNRFWRSGAKRPRRRTAATAARWACAAPTHYPSSVCTGHGGGAGRGCGVRRGAIRRGLSPVKVVGVAHRR